MSAHYEIASEFSQLVLQKRREEGDLATPILQPLHRTRFIPRGDEGQGELANDGGDDARPFTFADGRTVPTWHFRGKR